MRTRNALSILDSTFGVHGAADHELSSLLHADSGLIEFWRNVQTAELFKDITYGQWGLRILSPSDSILRTQAELIERPNEMLSTDRVFAEFIGGSDHLLMDLSFDHPTHKPIYVQLPIDRRNDWPKIADSFEQFLEKYVQECGDKFWERCGT